MDYLQEVAKEAVALARARVDKDILSEIQREIARQGQNPKLNKE